MIRRNLDEADLESENLARDLIKIGKMVMREQKISKEFRNALENIPELAANAPIAVAINARTQEDVPLITGYLNGTSVPSNTIRHIPEDRIVYAHLTRGQIYDLVQQSCVESVRPQRMHRALD